MFGPRVHMITTEELAERMKRGKPLLIDVREPSEFSAGHVPGAVNVPLGRLAEKVAKFDPSRETLLICESGSRSTSGARRLMKAGYTDVHSVRGGTKAWGGKLVR